MCVVHGIPFFGGCRQESIDEASTFVNKTDWSVLIGCTMYYLLDHRLIVFIPVRFHLTEFSVGSVAGLERTSGR